MFFLLPENMFIITGSNLKLQMMLRTKCQEEIVGIWKGGYILKQLELLVPYSPPLNSHYKVIAFSMTY